MKLPAPRYWFAGKALSDALGFIIGFSLTVVGVSTVFVNWFLTVLGIAGAGILALQWHAAARENLKDEIREQENKELRTTLNLIRDSIVPGAPKDASESTAVESLTGIPTSEIRKQVSALTKAMRVFEAGIKTAQTNALPRHFNPTQTDEQRTAEWEAQTRQMTQQSTDAQNEFRRRYLPEALAFREEMSKRLGMFPPYPADHRTVALDYGMLAGVSPISDAAAHLEELARKLS